MKRALKIIGIVIAVLVLLVIALPFIVDVNAFRPQIESELSSSLGREVKVGNLKLSILSGSVSADNLAISDDPAFSNQPFVRAKALDVGVELMPLIFSKSLQVNELTITDPQVALLRNATGKWNFSSIGSKPAPEPASAGQPAETGKTPEAQKASQPAAPKATPGKSGETAAAQASPASSNPSLSVGKLSVKNGTLSMENVGAHEKPQIYSKVNITVQNFVFNAQFPFTMSADLPGGGSMKLDGHAGPINATDASLTPLDAKISVSGLDIEKSGFVNPASGLGGVVDFNGTVNSNGREAQASGSAGVAKLKASPKGSPAPKPVDLKFNATYDLQKQSGPMNADVTLGKAVAKLSGTYQIEPAATTLNAKLAADNMPVDDLVTLLPALGVTLPAGSHLEGGTLTANFTIAGPTDRLVINGPVQLANTKLAGFDLGSKLSSVAKLAGVNAGPDTTIQNFSTDARVAPEGIQTKNVNLNVPSIGVITGNGTVSPQNALNYQMNAKFSGGALGGLSEIAGLGNKNAGIPFSIEGTTSDPKFVPNVKGMLGSEFGKFNPGGQGQNPANNVMNSLQGLIKKKPQ